MGLLGLGMMTACTNDDEAVNVNPNDGDKATAQIMISVAASNTTTRTETAGDSGDEVAATESENNIKSLTIVLADANGVAQQVVTPEMKTEITTNKEIRATEPFNITPGKFYVYVLANYEKNKENISPVIIGSTNMKQAFGITGTLSTANQFFMSNADKVEEVDFTVDGTDTEVDDDGTDVTNGEKVKLVEANIERVVSKVTFNNSNDAKFEVKDGNTVVAKATLQGVSLINLNKKMYIVKNKVTPTGITTPSWTNSWYYAEDPNYNSTTDLENNFSQAEAAEFSTPAEAVFYCPENTMAANAQLHGQTTGVVYKIAFAPENTIYVKLANGGTDAYSTVFTKVLSNANKGDITETIFDGDLETSDDVTEGSFYVYKGLIFKNKKAAYLYRAIDNKLSSQDGSDVITEYQGYAISAPEDVILYKGGVCYYTAWIKHNPTTQASMEHGKYGTVRNHWYELKVTGINALGHYEPTYENATDPDDPKKAKIQVQATVKKWVLVKQDVILGQ